MARAEIPARRRRSNANSSRQSAPDRDLFESAVKGLAGFPRGLRVVTWLRRRCRAAGLAPGWSAICGRRLPAALGAGGSGGTSAAWPAGLLPAGVIAVLLAADRAAQRAGQRLAACLASAARHIVTRRCRVCGPAAAPQGAVRPGRRGLRRRRAVQWWQAREWLARSSRLTRCSCCPTWTVPASNSMSSQLRPRTSDFAKAHVHGPCTAFGFKAKTICSPEFEHPAAAPSRIAAAGTAQPAILAAQIRSWSSTTLPSHSTWSRYGPAAGRASRPDQRRLIRLGAAQRPSPLVDHGQPTLQLGAEVRPASERPGRNEREACVASS
jgi:hypothetical protein